MSTSAPEWVCGFSDDDILLQVGVTKFREKYQITVSIAGEVIANNAEHAEADARKLAAQHFANWFVRLGTIHDKAVLKARHVGYMAGFADAKKQERDNA